MPDLREIEFIEEYIDQLEELVENASFFGGVRRMTDALEDFWHHPSVDIRVFTSTSTSSSSAQPFPPLHQILEEIPADGMAQVVKRTGWRSFKCSGKFNGWAVGGPLLGVVGFWLMYRNRRALRRCLRNIITSKSRKGTPGAAREQVVVLLAGTENPYAEPLIKTLEADGFLVLVTVDLPEHEAAYESKFGPYVKAMALNTSNVKSEDIKNFVHTVESSLRSTEECPNPYIHAIISLLGLPAIPETLKAERPLLKGINKTIDSIDTAPLDSVIPTMQIIWDFSPLLHGIHLAKDGKPAVLPHASSTSDTPRHVIVCFPSCKPRKMMGAHLASQVSLVSTWVSSFVGYWLLKRRMGQYKRHTLPVLGAEVDLPDVKVQAVELDVGRFYPKIRAETHARRLYVEDLVKTVSQALGPSSVTLANRVPRHIVLRMWIEATFLAMRRVIKERLIIWHGVVGEWIKDEPEKTGQESDTPVIPFRTRLHSACRALGSSTVSTTRYLAMHIGVGLVHSYIHLVGMHEAARGRVCGVYRVHPHIYYALPSSEKAMDGKEKQREDVSTGTIQTEVQAYNVTIDNQPIANSEPVKVKHVPEETQVAEIEPAIKHDVALDQSVETHKDADMQTDADAQSEADPESSSTMTIIDSPAKAPTELSVAPSDSASSDSAVSDSTFGSRIAPHSPAASLGPATLPAEFFTVLSPQIGARPVEDGQNEAEPKVNVVPPEPTDEDTNSTPQRESSPSGSDTTEATETGSWVSLDEEHQDA